MTPPTPIDLDLVELRCRLRGWQYEVEEWERDGQLRKCVVVLRSNPDAGPDFRLWVHMHLPYSRPDSKAMYEQTSVGWVHGSGFHMDETKAITRPRLTLADIIADPGEGWTAEDQADQVYFGWGEDFGLLKEASVTRDPDGKTLDFISARVQGERRIAAHRAVTDLLIRLAEVSP